jgi:hypothetical protein
MKGSRMMLGLYWRSGSRARLWCRRKKCYFIRDAVPQAFVPHTHTFLNFTAHFSVSSRTYGDRQSRPIHVELFYFNPTSD